MIRRGRVIPLTEREWMFVWGRISTSLMFCPPGTSPCGTNWTKQPQSSKNETTALGLFGNISFEFDCRPHFFFWTVSFGDVETRPGPLRIRFESRWSSLLLCRFQRKFLRAFHLFLYEMQDRILEQCLLHQDHFKYLLRLLYWLLNRCFRLLCSPLSHVDQTRTSTSLSN